MPSLPPGSHGVDGHPAAPFQPANGDHGQLMTTALESKSELPNSLARPSQRGRVAARVTPMIHQHTDAVRRNPGSQPEAPSRRLATCTLVNSARLDPPQSPARIEITIKTHRAGVVERFSPIRRDACADRKSTRLNSSHANISYAVF